MWIGDDDDTMVWSCFWVKFGLVKILNEMIMRMKLLVCWGGNGEFVMNVNVRVKIDSLTKNLGWICVNHLWRIWQKLFDFEFGKIVEVNLCVKNVGWICEMDLREVVIFWICGELGILISQNLYDEKDLWGQCVNLWNEEDVIWECVANVWKLVWWILIWEMKIYVLTMWDDFIWF